MENKENKGKRSYTPLIWLGMYLVNLILVLVFQALFVYNIPLPEAETADGYPDFSQVEFFRGSEILDIAGTSDEYHILYRDEGGTKLVKLEGNLYFRRFDIKESTVTEIPGQSGEQIIELPNFLGKDTVTITDSARITGLESGGGLIRQQSTIQAFHAGTAIVLLLIEAVVVLLLKKLLRR